MSAHCDITYPGRSTLISKSKSLLLPFLFLLLVFNGQIHLFPHSFNVADIHQQRKEISAMHSLLMHSHSMISSSLSAINRRRRSIAVTTMNLATGTATEATGAGIAPTATTGGSNYTKRREGMGKAKGYNDLSLRYQLEYHNLSGLPDTTRPFTVLGIETSCDDTGAAVVRSDGTILSNVVYSQHDIHMRFGGIVPSLALAAHQSNIGKAVDEALLQAGLTIDDIDAVAATKGPGLEICLRVGYKHAQSLASEHRKPFVNVHHLEAHCLMARLIGSRIKPEEEEGEATATTTSSQQLVSKVAPVDPFLRHHVPTAQFPFLALLASGGHTSILLCKDLGDYEVLGGTLDDALGEGFDKVARLVGLRTAGSGGAAVEKLAQRGDVKRYPMKVPMKDKNNCDFSYAGLKNAFRLIVERARLENGIANSTSSNAPGGSMEIVEDVVELPERVKADLCAAYQNVALAHVEDRIVRALDFVEQRSINITSLVIVGGVAANKELRRRLAHVLSNRQVARPESTLPAIDLICPPPKLCTDNGVMSAWAGIEKFSRGISDAVENNSSNSSSINHRKADVISRWPLGTPIEGGGIVIKPPKKNKLR